MFSQISLLEIILNDSNKRNENIFYLPSVQNFTLEENLRRKFSNLFSTDPAFAHQRLA